MWNTQKRLMPSMHEVKNLYNFNVMYKTPWGCTSFKYIIILERA